MTSNSIFPIFATQIQNTNSSRLLVTLESNVYDFGITSGDVIRYDTVGKSYKKSIADSSVNAEVFGIVESVGISSSINVVINGSIKYPENRLNILPLTSSYENLGGNDIYFLSGTTHGVVENVGGYNTVIKPILVMSPHGEYNGIVRNYIGIKNVNVATTHIAYSSENISKFILYDMETNLNLYSSSYNSLTFSFTLTLIKNINLNDISLSGIDFSSDTSDIKVSNDGNDILIFSKHLNKIFHVNLISSPAITAIINLDISGNSVDKIWAVDDEFTSMTISTLALSRDSVPGDCKVTTRDVSSRILYYKRSPYTKNKFNWRKVNENQANGSCTIQSHPIQSALSDSIPDYPGVYRTSDIKCRGKNYIFSSKCLKSDQIAYKIAANGHFSERYNTSQFNFMDYYASPISSIVIRNLNKSSIQSDVVKAQFSLDFFFQVSANYYPNQPTLDDLISLGHLASSFGDNVNNKKYKCSFGVRNFKICRYENNKLVDDVSCLSKAPFTYYNPTKDNEIYYRNIPEVHYPSGITFLNKLMVAEIFGETITSPTYNQNSLLSKTSCADNFFIIAFLYEFTDVNNTVMNRQLVISKFPTESYDGNTIFDYFQYSNKYGSVVPDPSGFGLISSFRSDTLPEVLNSYSPTTISLIHSRLYENPTFFIDQVLTTPDINQLNYFEVFTSNDRYFLCTSTYVIIYTYTSSTNIILYKDDMDQYRFYFNADGEFFIKNDKIYRYDPIAMAFTLISKNI